MQTEFVRSLNCNYERILLEKKPQEQRYQYCILNRGGIRGLLSCNLRYIDGEAYLYYDISSRQNMKQLLGSRSITREALLDFFDCLYQVRLELERFLLDGNNILLFPEEIFRDLETRDYYFLYVPYYEEQRGCKELLDFLAEHIEYSDEGLVECVYGMYEQLERCGEVYFESQIFADAKQLTQKQEETALSDTKPETDSAKESPALPSQESKKTLFSFLDGRRKKGKESREDYREAMKSVMEGRAVAEEPDPKYGDDSYGRTLYIEETNKKTPYKELCTAEGRALARIEDAPVTIGKKKDEAVVVLEDPSVSRLHARINKEGDEFYLEDLNSTNGTYKNGLRLQPYEKRVLESGDEVRVGRVQLLFR